MGGTCCMLNAVAAFVPACLSHHLRLSVIIKRNALDW